MTVDSNLISILACPACKSAVKEFNEAIVCQNASCGLKFPIRNGIPVMLIEEAQRAGK